MLDTVERTRPVLEKTLNKACFSLCWRQTRRDFASALTRFSCLSRWQRRPGCRPPCWERTICLRLSSNCNCAAATAQRGCVAVKNEYVRDLILPLDGRALQRERRILSYCFGLFSIQCLASRSQRVYVYKIQSGQPLRSAFPACGRSFDLGLIPNHRKVIEPEYWNKHSRFGIGLRGATYLNDSRVLLAALLELLIVELCILVHIHLGKDLVDSLKQDNIQASTKDSESAMASLLTFSGVSSSSGSLTI